MPAAGSPPGPIEVPIGDGKVCVNAEYELAPDCSPVANPECALAVGNPDWDMDGCGMSEEAVYIENEAHEQPKAPGLRMVSLLCMVGGLEGADCVLLPCVFYALQQDLGLSLNDLAVMSMVQGLAGNFASPLWGVMADRGILRRKTIIVIGCIGQGLITVVLAGVDRMLPMLMLRVLNGAFLASLRPIANGIVADVTAEVHRGKVYGGMGIAMNVGTMLGTLIGTNLARRQVMGLQGWRVAFMIVGAASVVVGLIAGLLMQEPPRNKSALKALEDASGKTRGLAAVKAELWELGSYFRMPSFCVLIVQGMFGTVPWNALAYKTMFFQLGGIRDFEASLIDVFSQVAGSFGGLLGGIVGDGLSRCSPHHGRTITAQISVLAGIPVAWFIFMSQPPSGGAFTYYLLLMVVLGLTATWCGNGVNLPILSQIVKDDRRATIMAWEGTLESTSSAVFGNAMVGILAENLFGYDLSSVKDSKNTAANTKALGTAMMLVSFFPWILCFAFYSLLHWSYPRDLRWLAEQEQKAQQQLRQQKQQQQQQQAAAKLACGAPPKGEAAFFEGFVGDEQDEEQLELEVEQSPKAAAATRPTLSTAAARAAAETVAA